MEMEQVQKRLSDSFLAEVEGSGFFPPKKHLLHCVLPSLRLLPESACLTGNQQPELDSGLPRALVNLV